MGCLFKTLKQWHQGRELVDAVHYVLELVDDVLNGLLLPSQLFKGFGLRFRRLLQEFLGILELGQFPFQIEYHDI